MDMISLLDSALGELLEAQKKHDSLNFQQAMDLENAINRIQNLLAELEEEREIIHPYDLTAIDQLIEACQQ